MRLVVDAGVAVKWLLDEEDSAAAHGLLAGADELHAPRLMASEVADALWWKARLGEIGRSRAGATMAAVSEMPVHWHADETVSADAGRLALALDLGVFDCIYLALAHRIGATLVTADRRVVNALPATEHGGAVVELAEYAKTST